MASPNPARFERKALWPRTEFADLSDNVAIAELFWQALEDERQCPDTPPEIVEMINAKRDEIDHILHELIQITQPINLRWAQIEKEERDR